MGNREVKFISLYVVFHAISAVEVLVNGTDFVCKPKTISCSCSTQFKGETRTREVLIETTSCDRDDVNVCESINSVKEKCLQADSGLLEKKKKRYRRGQKCKPYWNHAAPFGLPNITFISNLSSEYTVDSTLDIFCHVYSNPEANVYWLFNGMNITSSRYDANTCKNWHHTLTIRTLQTSDIGTFTCVANNSFGSSNRSVYLNVKIKLKPPIVRDFRIDGGQQVAYLGGSLNLSCDIIFYGTIGSTDQWFSRHGKTVLDTKRHINVPPTANPPPASSNTYTYKLWFRNVTLEEQGNWTCSGVKNALKASRTFYLKTVPCPAGYYCPWRGNSKYPCRKGTYSEGRGNTTYQCIECPNRPSALEKPAAYKIPATSLDECLVDPPSSSSMWFIALAVIPVVAVLVGIVWYRNRVRRSSSGYREVPITDMDSFETSSMEGSRTTLIRNSLHAANSHSNGNHEIGLTRTQRQDHVEDHTDTEEFPTVYDVFISYSSKDITFAKEIHDKLEKEGFKCCIDLRDFMPGEDINVNISNAIYQSRNTLALLSPDFINSEYCNTELQQALTRNIRHHQVIPILYKDCDVPNELKHMTYIDYVNCHGKSYFWDQLRNSLGNVFFQLV